MKPESEKIRELIESLDFSTPDQRSTYDQLLSLHQLANKNGLYDAADWLNNHLNRMRAK